MDNKRVGRFISKLRKSKDLTQNELAEKLSISNKTVSKWETGEGLPDVSVLPELAQVLGVSIDEILNAELKEETRIKVEEVANEKNLLNIYHICFLISCFICTFGALLGGFTEVYCAYNFKILFYTHWEIIFAAVAFFCIAFGNLLFYISALRLNVIYPKEKIIAMSVKKMLSLFVISVAFVLTFFIRLIDKIVDMENLEMLCGALILIIIAVICSVVSKRIERKYNNEG
ncbi:MAG: helix-turn-helix transcriptional regulator [Eubacterium sp.]|nr:helix-turn-helix transcriptional regulator [Eubacterium sp.]